MLPHRPADDTDSDRNLVSISARSRSFRIEPIVILLRSFSWENSPQFYKNGVPLGRHAAEKQLTVNSLLRVFDRFETSAVDNFTQLGFVQLRVVVLDNGLALVGTHLCVFNAFGGFERFGNRRRAFRALHSLNLNRNRLGECRGCDHADRYHQNTSANQFNDST
jgi:hypothetical protein